MLDQIHAALFTGIKYWHQQDERFWRPSPQGGSWSLQLSETGMKDPQEWLTQPWQCTASVCVAGVHCWEISLG